MDVTSYLLGKNAGGGGQTINNQDKSVTITQNGNTNVSADTGYTGLGTVAITTNVSADMSKYFTSTITYGDSTVSGLYKMIKTIPAETTVDGTTLYKAFSNSLIEEVPIFDISNVKILNGTFSNCVNLKTIPILDMSSVTNLQDCFNGCTNFETLPQLNTPSLLNLYQTFYGCTKLKDIPLLDTAKVTDFRNTFYGCPALTDTSLDNILQMCANTTKYTRTKTLADLGFTSANYSTARIQALPHYQDFVNAGWSIGY